MTNQVEKGLKVGATPHNLPNAETYEKEFRYFPWGKLIQEVKERIARALPRNGRMLDLFCGPGYLLGSLQKDRPDGHYTGIDISADYITNASKLRPDITFVCADVQAWEPTTKYDVVTCTAGLHHVPYTEQELVLKKIADSVTDTGIVIIADPLIDNFSDDDEMERKLAAAKLGYEYLKAVIENDSPDDILQAAAQILDNDVRGIEYKTSLAKIEPLFRKYFPHVEIQKKWPVKDSAYGDYYFVLRKNI